MFEVQGLIVIGLLVVAIPLVALARRFEVPYPIVLVVGGLALGFVPRLPQIQLDPNVVLLLFLPPLLYWEAITAPTDIMWENRKQIGLLALGLVFVSTIAVAVVAHSVIAGMSWPVAFVLGAIVAPTDELASEPVLERFHIPRHVIAIVVGESLLNDAVSLVLYAAAVATVVSGVFDVRGTALLLVLGAVGSIVVGTLIGRVAVEGWRRIKDTELQAVISLLLPFVAYLPAQRLGTSGVLEVIATGVLANRSTPTVLTPQARLRLTGFWETFVFIANAVLFLLVGLQLHTIAARVFAEYAFGTVLWYAFAVNACVIIVRFAWILGTEYLPLGDSASEHEEPNIAHAVVASWSGLRGAVSLAAALAVPIAVSGGAPFPLRSLIIFLTFTVILVTLVGGGLTLPLIIRAFHMTGDTSEEDEELRRALSGVADAALARIAELTRDGAMQDGHAHLLRKKYERLRATTKDAHMDASDEEPADGTNAEREVIDAERRALIELRDRGEIDNAVLRKVQLQLDLAESRTRR